MKKLCLLVAVVMLITAVLGGCAPSDSSTESPAVDSSASGSPSTASSGGIKEVAREKTLIFENIEGRISDPGNQNPYSAAQYLDWGLWQANQECLFYYNYETGEIMPWQATSYEFNDDFNELTINLREGVKWSDGEDFTADDVVFTINMLKENAGLRYSTDMNEWVDDVVKVNDSEVKFVLTGSNPSFLFNYFVCDVWDAIPIAPEHIWSAVDDPVNFSNYDLDKGWPVGTGAYTLVKSTESEQVYDRNDEWWGAETGFEDLPEPERCIWITCSSEEVRASMLVNNELDAAWTLGRGTYETAISQNDKIIGWTEDVPYAYLDAVPSVLCFNNAVFPGNDPDIKWALAYAINQQELVDIAAEGLSDPAQTMYPTYPILKEWLESNQDILDKYDVTIYDLDKSAAIMESKGYTKDSDGYWVDGSGNRISFTILYRSGETLNVKEAPVICQQLNDAGFEIDSQALESAVFYNEIYSGSHVACFGGALGSVKDPYATFDFFHSKYSKPIGESTDARHYRWVNKEYDSYVDIMASTTADTQEFQDAARAALDIWLENLPTIPIMQQYLLTPFNETYWTNWPTSGNNYVHPGHWWYTCAIMIHNVHSAE